MKPEDLRIGGIYKQNNNNVLILTKIKKNIFGGKTAYYFGISKNYMNIFNHIIEKGKMDIRDFANGAKCEIEKELDYQKIRHTTYRKSIEKELKETRTYNKIGEPINSDKMEIRFHILKALTVETFRKAWNDLKAQPKYNYEFICNCIDCDDQTGSAGCKRTKRIIDDDGDCAFCCIK